MKCEKCGNDNEADARFCRNCGSELTTIMPKAQVDFVPSKQHVLTEDTTASIVIGIVFIAIGLLVGFIILLPAAFDSFINSIGSFFGGFGETMGQWGSDFGNFMGNWGENFGESVGNFFAGEAWWDILRILIPALFIIPGLIIVLFAFRKR
ncbi:MAG: zinc-ribbon domain-containing protein [Candidatus Hodarchaeota archaeon]